MKCFKCNEEKVCIYSPKEQTKYDIGFCKNCLELIKYKDIRYLENTKEEFVNKEVKKLIKKRENL